MYQVMDCEVTLVLKKMRPEMNHMRQETRVTTAPARVGGGQDINIDELL